MTDLINTLETPGEFDALTTLRPGEPYFLLVGRDRLAPPLVRDWADRSRRKAMAEHGEGKLNDEQLLVELRKATQAEMIAEGMVEFKTGAVEEVAVKEAAPATYTGHVLPEETARRDRIRSARSRALAAVNNAVAELVEFNEVAELIDIVPGIDRLRELAEELTPERPGIAA